MSWTTTLGAQYGQNLTQKTGLSHTKDRVSTLERFKYGNVNATRCDSALRTASVFSVGFV